MSKETLSLQNTRDRVEASVPNIAQQKPMPLQDFHIGTPATKKKKIEIPQMPFCGFYIKYTFDGRSLVKTASSFFKIFPGKDV